MLFPEECESDEDESEDTKEAQCRSYPIADKIECVDL